jgi:hypothetical protein
MKGLTTSQFGRACRIFLDLAYPAGELGIPPAKRLYYAVKPDQVLTPLLTPPVCQPVLTSDGRVHGYAFRLGSSHFPHLKLRVVSHDRSAECIFSVDTHDTVQVDAAHPDAERWRQLQADNRRLKEQIEHAWEAAGLLTFHGLLRRGLEA